MSCSHFDDNGDWRWISELSLEKGIAANQWQLFMGQWQLFTSSGDFAES
jgi:hypothetical protein